MPHGIYIADSIIIDHYMSCNDNLQVCLDLGIHLDTYLKRLRSLGIDPHLTKYADSFTESDFYVEYNKGLSSAKIALNLRVPKDSVNNFMRRNGIVFNYKKGNPPIPYDEFSSYCSKCHEVFPNDNFPFVRGVKDGRRLSYCRECRKKQSRVDLFNSPESYWREKTGRLKNTAIRDNLKFNLSPDYLYNMWLILGGTCFYSGRDLKPQQVTDYRDRNDLLKSNSIPSVDKVIPENGYVEGNVVICSNRINSLKRDMTLQELKEYTPGWFTRLVDSDMVTSVQEEIFN